MKLSNPSRMKGLIYIYIYILTKTGNFLFIYMVGYWSPMKNAKQPNTQSEEKLPENQNLNKYLQMENEYLRISILQLIRLRITGLGENG